MQVFDGLIGSLSAWVNALINHLKEVFGTKVQCTLHVVHHLSKRMYLEN